MRRAVDRALETCWLRDVQRRRIGTLSKGYRQRVGLAAAMAHEPPVLLLDEPSSGLDPAQIVETRALLRSLAGRHTVVLSSHILPEVEKTCERLIVIGRGRVLADGAPKDLIASHGSGAVVVEFSEPRPGSVVAALRSTPGVSEVEERTGDGRWRVALVTPRDPAADLREAVGACVLGAGGALRELRHETDAIESLFASLIERAEGGDP